MRKLVVPGLRTLIHVAALLPLAAIAWDFAFDQLTANPIDEVTLRTGRAALVLLMLSLACTPVNMMFGVKWVLRLRRPLGLYAFFYASLHLLTIVGLDYQFDFIFIREDLAVKRFALVGLAAYLSLLPLAVTSTSGWKRRLGGRWQRLHWLAYPAVLLAVTHFSLQEKADYRVPALYGAVVVFLLVVRIPGVRKAVGKPRRLAERRLRNRRTTDTVARR
jgi:sulfoxide reductase heme-binding subunit YedZ